MFRDGSQQAYGQAIGTQSTNYPVIDKRDPTSNDIFYVLGKFWINQAGIRLWYLNNLSNATGQLQATWELISTSSILVSISDTGNTPVFPSLPSATPPDNIQLIGGAGISIVATPASNLLTISNTGAGTETLTGNDGVAVSPTLGTIQTLGVTVANGTFSRSLWTASGGGNVENFNIQASAAIAASDVTKAGVSAFNNTQFTVNSSTGFVSLIGGTTPPVLGLTPDAHTAPGTSPVIPNGSGNIIITGNQIAAGTTTNVIRSDSLAANTLTIEIQRSQAVASSTIGDNGVSHFNSSQFTVDGNGFVSLAGAGAVIDLTGDDGLAVVPTANNINLTGVTVANSTHTKPVFFAKNATSTEELDVQVSAAIASTNINKTGLAAFSSAQFSVDANGFVTLASAGAVTDLTGDDGLAVVPTANNINLTGSTVANGTHAKPVFFLKNATSTEELDVQVAAANASSNINKAGLASFNSTDFTVDANGFVTIIGGSTSPAVTSFITDVNSPVVPNASGQVTVTATQVVTGTTNNVIRTDGITANTLKLDVQRTTTSAVSNANLNGVCHFSSTNFTVDANGFVQFTGSATSFPWTVEAAPFNAASNNGYLCTASLTATLPPTPANGDVIRFIMDTGSSVTVQANTGQKIRLGNVITAAAGTAASTRQGDSLNLVYISATGNWYAMSSQGTWGLT